MINLTLSKQIFNPTYLPHLFDYSKRYEVYYGSAGSGKSHFVFQKAIVKACNFKRRFLVVRKVGRTHLNSTFQLTIDTLAKFKILSMCNINKSTLTITLPNGSCFIYYGCDDPEKLKSIAGITDIICEEATELTVSDFTQLDLRLRPKEENPQIYCMFNPVSKTNWVYKRWFSEDSVDDGRTMILKTTYKDNKFLTDEYITSLLAMEKTNPTYYKIYVLGDFCTLDKLIYNNYEVSDFDYTTIKGQTLVGLDWGFTNDTTALVASILDEENKTIYIFREWGDTNKTNGEIADIIKSLGFSKSTIICDSAEPKSIEELRRAGIAHVKASVKGPDSIIHGIQKLQQYKIVVHPDCPKTITELENYAWQKDRGTGEYINKPIDEFNHFLDALRYSNEAADKGRMKVLDRSLLGL